MNLLRLLFHDPWNYGPMGKHLSTRRTRGDITQEYEHCCSGWSGGWVTVKGDDDECS